MKKIIKRGLAGLALISTLTTYGYYINRKLPEGYDIKYDILNLDQNVKTVVIYHPGTLDIKKRDKDVFFRERLKTIDGIEDVVNITPCVVTALISQDADTAYIKRQIIKEIRKHRISQINFRC